MSRDLAVEQDRVGDREALWRRRFTIRETFRDTKDIRFGLGLSATHIGRTDRRDRLLLLFAIAHAPITLLGAASEASQLDRTLKVSTATHRTHSLYWQGNFRLNRLLQRRGTFWADRHHRRDLESPSQVRNTLVYVLQNHAHHGMKTFCVGLVDAYATAHDFDGWVDPTVVLRATEPGGRPPAGGSFASDGGAAGGASGRRIFRVSHLRFGMRRSSGTTCPTRRSTGDGAQSALPLAARLLRLSVRRSDRALRAHGQGGRARRQLTSGASSATAGRAQVQ